jgi:Spy/CpxP family protein refolding chaperone
MEVLPVKNAIAALALILGSQSAFAAVNSNAPEFDPNNNPKLKAEMMGHGNCTSRYGGTTANRNRIRSGAQTAEQNGRVRPVSGSQSST